MQRLCPHLLHVRRAFICSRIVEEQGGQDSRSRNKGRWRGGVGCAMQVTVNLKRVHLFTPEGIRVFTYQIETGL